MDDFLQMTKPRIVTMVLVTTAIGYLLGGQGIPSLSVFLVCLLGTGLAAAGSAVLNNYVERETDRLMARTRQRALPAGRMDPAHALAFGVLLSLGGVGLLVWKVNLLAGFVVLLTAFLYVLVYTPLKRVTWLNTSIGAIPGALPPVTGWVAATGELEWGAWVLFGILFAWQHPHFYSIAWMYQQDYARAGYKMLPVVEPDGERMFRHVIFYSLLLLPVSMAPSLMGLTGPLYLAGAAIAGSFFLSVGLLVWSRRSQACARQLLRASVIYLPVLLALIVVDLGL